MTQLSCVLSHHQCIVRHFKVWKLLRLRRTVKRLC